MKQLSILMFAALLAGCASAPPPAQVAAPVQLFADASFQPSTGVLTPEQIFALTPEMKQYAATVRQNLRGRNVHEALFEALYRRDQLRLEYDSELTRTAAQAFNARSGNCLSLVIMTAALARELELTVQFQQILAQDTWSRNGSLYFNNGHVNLVLGKKASKLENSWDRSYFLTVDFLPPEDIERLEKVPLEQHTIIAMFMNNRAAEAMVRGKLDDAYWWARAAIEHDPNFMVAYNTLSIIYQRHGQVNEAERVLRFASQRAPDNNVTLFNLAQILDETGQHKEALAIKQELERREPNPPFYYFNLGVKAMEARDFQRARALFARELQRAPYYHEFHFWMAKAAFEMGDTATADKHLQLAMTNSTTRGDHDLYAAKHDALKMYESKVRLRPQSRAN